jgi:MoaA/NifB/PqqE/SkfB family radical SAM enzyme
VPGYLEKNCWQPVVHVPQMDVNQATSEVIIELLKGDHRLELFGGKLEGTPQRCPFAERGSLSVRWDGKVSPCLPLLYTHTQYLDDRKRSSQAFFVGDLREQDLPSIWNKDSYVSLRESLDMFDFSPCVLCNSCDMVDQNLEDCYGNVHPTCGGCLWAQGLIRCP